jgi:pyruvate ferredoxin oxidoreductase gamma subunit
VIEIRWHGRAGQGAKTASQLLAAASMAAGKNVQAFPEYGPERSGAPMRAYTRIGDEKIRRRYGVTEPDVVVVLDESLLREAAAAEGLRDGGVLIVNSEHELEGAICVPATKIAAQGAGYVNVVMLGAVAAALHEPSLDALLAAAAKKGVATADVEAGYRAVEELRCAA